MNRIPLINNEFHIEVLNRKDRQIVITYHESIKKDTAIIEQLKFIMSRTYDKCHSLDLPIFLKQGNTYKLVSRYWLLSYILDMKIDAFPAIVFQDESLIPDIIAHEDFYITLFNRRVTPIHFRLQKANESTGEIKIDLDAASSQTQSRHELREKGRICPGPKCRGVLVKETRKKKEPKQIRAHSVSCQNKNNPKPCTFHASLTGNEFDLFKNKRLKTKEWITLLPNEKCEKCHDLVFRRTIHHDEKRVEVIDRCAKYYFQENPSCKWFRWVKKSQP